MLGESVDYSFNLRKHTLHCKTVGATVTRRCSWFPKFLINYTLNTVHGKNQTFSNLFFDTSPHGNIYFRSSWIQANVTNHIDVRVNISHKILYVLVTDLTVFFWSFMPSARPVRTYCKFYLKIKLKNKYVFLFCPCINVINNLVEYSQKYIGNHDSKISSTYTCTSRLFPSGVSSAYTSFSLATI